MNTKNEYQITGAHSITSADGVTRIHVTIHDTTHVLDPDDASALALQVKDTVPAVVSVDGRLFTISMGFDMMSCSVKDAVAALVKAGKVVDVALVEHSDPPEGDQ